MMNLLYWAKSILTKKSVLAFVALVVLIFSFQNCSKTKFTKVSDLSLASTAASIPVSPICNLSSRPQDSDYVACLPPKQSILQAIQKYNVICQANGAWSRTASGNIDYSLCSNVCDPSKRLSDKENVACPAPFASEIKGVQSYAVSCLSDGSWSRTVTGAADYSACSKVCDPNTKPAASSSVLCPAPFNTINSGTQNYTVTCNSNGTWSRINSGSVDYKNCPQSCDPSKMPSLKDPALCPTSSAMNAFQNYSVSCSVSGTWIRTPTNFDISNCAQAQTCNPNTKPSSSDPAFCSAPYQTVKSAIQNYSVTCSGINWVQVATSKDESACPKSCSGNQPANSVTMIACQSPYQSSILAKQNYTYICNSTTGGYDKTASGSVDYSSCPKSCAGPVPSTHVAVNCPVGMSGQAYQNYSATCNTTTGNYDLASLGVDNSGCSVTVQACSGPQPPTVEAISCPSPFADRYDAKQNYSVSCVNGSWSRAAIGNVDTSSCPVNDCTGSPNPGTQKIIGSCPSGATGSVTQTCSLSCTGKTYSQVSCSANDYSSCDCGPNATFNTGTQSCVPKPATCVASSTQNPAIACGAGYSGGTKYTTTTTSCPGGSYGAPVITTSGYNLGSCATCPAATTSSFTPTCASNENAVANSGQMQTSYSCDSGSAVPTQSVISAGICNVKLNCSSEKLISGGDSMWMALLAKCSDSDPNVITVRQNTITSMQWFFANDYYNLASGGSMIYYHANGKATSTYTMQVSKVSACRWQISALYDRTGGAQYSILKPLMEGQYWDFCQ